MPKAEVQEQEDAELRQFFVDAEYRLDLADATQRQVDHKLATGFNVFRLIDPDENKLSEVLAELLNPCGTHGQGNLFLCLMLKIIGVATSGKATEQALVQCEAPTHQIPNFRRRFDILVEAPGLLFGIENKVDSLDQPEQLKAYFQHLTECRKRQSTNGGLVYLTPNGRAPSPSSLSLVDVERYRSTGMLWCWSYQTDVRDWLEQCRQACEAEKVRFFLADFIAYIDSDLEREPEEDKTQ